MDPQPTDTDRGDRQQSSESSTPVRRAYKACLACRARKCKCDLGDIDAPSSPPCGRCRREGRECMFVESRRGMRPKSTPSVPTSERADALDSVVRRLHGSSDASDAPTVRFNVHFPDTVSGESNRTSMVPTLESPNRPTTGREANILAAELPVDPYSQDGVYNQIMSGLWPWPDQDDANAPTETPADFQTHYSPAQVPPTFTAAAAAAAPFDDPVPTSTDDTATSYVLVDKGVIDWDHVINLATEYFRNVHLFMPFLPPDRIPVNQTDMMRFARKEPDLLTAIIVTTSKSRNSPFFRRIHDEAWLYMQTTMSRVLDGDTPPDLGLIEGILLVIDELPRKQRQPSHTDALRQRWMLLGFATRCACQLGLHRNDLLEGKSPAYRARASVVWTYCFVWESHLNMFVQHGVSTKISFPRTRALSNHVGPMLAADNFPGLCAQDGSQSDNACMAQSMLDFSQFVGSVHDTLYSSLDRIQERIESGEYFVTMNSLTEGLQDLEDSWSNKKWQDERCRIMVGIMLSAAKLYTFSANLLSTTTPHLEHIRPTKHTRSVGDVESQQHMHMATSAAIDLLRIATSQDHNAPPFLRLIDHVELASVVLLEALQCGWRSREDPQQIFSLIEKASTMLSKSTPSDPSIETCGKAVASWCTSLATNIGQDTYLSIPPRFPQATSNERQYPTLDSGAFPRPSNRRDLGIRARADHRQPYNTYSRAPSVTEEHEAALVLEDLALSRGKNVERITGEAGPNLYGELQIPLVPNSDQSNNGLFANYLGLHVLPDRERSEFIIRYYIQDVNWLMCCIHVPTFERECLAWWERPPTKVVDETEIAFLPLYTACLVLGLHLMSVSGLQRLGYTSEDRSRICRDCWQLGFTALQNADWMQVHNLKSVQAIIIIGPYLVSMWRSEFHWTLLGSAIKVAQNLRLSRLGPEPSKGASRESIRKMYGSRWVEAADREIARRVWWCLVELDWTFAAEHEFNASISGDFVTSLPANIADSDLYGHGPVVSKPMSVRTPMSFILNRWQLFRPFRDLLETSNRRGKLDHTSVMKTHDAITLNIAHASPFYHDDADLSDYTTDAEDMRRCETERNTFHKAADLRLVRLHRFHSSLADRLPKYSFSRKICVRAAKNIITRGEPFEPPSNYWFTPYGLFTSCVVLLLETTHASKQQAVELRNYIQSGIASLRLNTEITGKATAADYLQQLLDAESQLEATTLDETDSRKRTRQGEEVETSSLSRLIKKVRLGQETGQTLDSTYAAEFLNFNLPSYTGPGVWPVDLSGNDIPDQYLSEMQDRNIFDLVQLIMGDTALEYGQTGEQTLGSS